MASKQQQIDQSKKVISHPLILMNVEFNDDKLNVLKNLRRNHPGVIDIAQYYIEDNDGKSIPAVRIEMKSEDLAKELIKTNRVVIENTVYSIETAGQVLIAMKVSTNVSIENLSRDLSHNYTSIATISRFYDDESRPVDCIRVNLKSDSSRTQFLKDKYIYIDGKKSPIQPCWSLVVPMERPATTNRVNQVAEKPKQVAEKSKQVVERPHQVALTERRVKQLFEEHQQELNNMVRQFETKWNTRLSQWASSSSNSNVDPLTSIIRDLSVVCQQFSHQNSQIQARLNTALRQSQNVQMCWNRDDEYPLLPIQNGH